jgi:lysophospholipase L1-like esterase
MSMISKTLKLCRRALLLPVLLVRTKRGAAKIAPPSTNIVEPARAARAPVATRLDAGQASLSPGTYREATYFKRVWFPRGATEIQAVCLNQALRLSVGEVIPDHPYITALSIEYQGSLHPLFFNDGRREAELQPGDSVLTSPLDIRINPGDSAIIRDYRKCRSLGQTWPCAGTVAAVREIGEGICTGGNYTDTPSPTLLPFSVGALAQPGAIIGIPIIPGPTVLINGSSSFQGTGDKTNPDGPSYTAGYASRALGEIGIPYVRQSASGITAEAFLTNNRFRRELTTTIGVSTILVGLGSNDFGQRVTAEIICERILRILSYASALNKNVILYTYTPRNTSYDSWNTSEGQTIDLNQATRASVNKWLMGELTHPSLLGVVDANIIVEDSKSPGKWRTDHGSLTKDGLHLNPAGHKLVAEQTVTQLRGLLSPR